MIMYCSGVVGVLHYISHFYIYASCTSKLIVGCYRYWCIYKERARIGKYRNKYELSPGHGVLCMARC